MKSLLMMLIASVIAITSFAQKAKAFEIKTKPATITTGPASYSVKEEMKRTVTRIPSNSLRVVVNSDNGHCPQCKKQFVVNRTSSKQVAKVYTCSMHPQMTCSKNGKCAVCKS